MEELLNYFSYFYPDPKAGEPFSVTTEVAPCPWASGHRLLRIGLKSKAIEARALPPSHLTFLQLIAELRAEDTVAIVVYAGSEGLALPPTNGSQQRVILDAVNRLESGGSTAGGAGIRLAYATARSMYRFGANNRVILATDGDFNVGVQSDEELIRLIESERDHGIALTVLGFGTGNLKDSTLEALADHGNGHYAYVDTILEARRVLVEQMGATLETVAKDVKVQVEFNPARVSSYRLIGYENRRLTTEEFRDDRKDAGDMGAGHSVTALYELAPVTPERLPEDSFTVHLRYKNPHSNQSTELAIAGCGEAGTSSGDFRFAAAIAQFGLVLANSAHKGTASLESAIKLAEPAAGGDAARVEFVALARKALALE